MENEKAMQGKHTIKGRVLRVSLTILLIYAAGILLIIGKLFPRRYLELQKELNMDILQSANQSLSEALENVYREYEGLLNDEAVVEAFEEIGSFYASDVRDIQNNLDYLRAEKILTESRQEIVFLAAKTISDFFYIVDDNAVGVSEKDRVECDIPALIQYLAGFGDMETVFSCTDDIEEYGGRRDFVVCFPMYDSEKKVLGKICFFLNRDKEYVVWGEDELIILNSDNQVMFRSGALEEFNDDDFLWEEDKQYEREVNGKKYLIASAELELYNWKLVHILSMEKFQQTINEIMIFTGSIIIAVFFLAFLLMGSMSRMISYNMEKVTEEMDNFLGGGVNSEHMQMKEVTFGRWMNRFSLNQKFWIYYGTLIIFPMLLVSAVVFGRCQNVIQTEYEKNARILSDYSYQIVENRLYDDTYALRTILLDSSLMKNIYAYACSEDEDEKKKLYYDIAMRIQKINKECEVSYYDTSGNFMFSWPNMEEQKKQNLTININYNEKTVWDEYNGRYSFYMVRRMYMKSDEYMGDIGYLVLQIHEDALYGILKNRNSEIEYSFADKQNIIFASSNSEELGERLDSDDTGVKGICYYEDMTQYGIAARIVIAEENMAELKNFLAWVLILWTGGILVIVIVEERRSCNRVLDPVIMVNDALFKGEEIDLSRQTGDELDALILSVDRMKKRINSLIDELYENEIITRELELKVFRAQITPHFLCNTLERISALIDMEDDRAETLVVLLGKFFRQGISQDKLLITLEEEIKYTQVYIQIHKIVLEERLEVIWKIPEELLQYQTVQFLLQPVIENSLKHGQFREKDYRRIIVKGYERENDIVIAVADNGIGIAGDKLREIRESLRNKHADSRSKGLKNVHERLRLTFGEEYGMKIYSIQGKGVYVFMKIPKEK